MSVTDAVPPEQDAPAPPARVGTFSGSTNVELRELRIVGAAMLGNEIADEVARVGREAGRREQDRASRPPFAFAWQPNQTFTNPQDVIPVGYTTMDVATAERMGLQKEQIEQLTQAIEKSAVPDAPQRRLVDVEHVLSLYRDEEGS